VPAAAAKMIPAKNEISVALAAPPVASRPTGPTFRKKITRIGFPKLSAPAIRSLLSKKKLPAGAQSAIADSRTALFVRTFFGKCGPTLLRGERSYAAA